MERIADIAIWMLCLARMATRAVTLAYRHHLRSGASLRRAAPDVPKQNIGHHL